MNPEVMEASFTPECTICSILPREDGQNFTIANRTHGVYYVNHPKNGESYALSKIPWKRDYADVGDYDPAYTKRSGIEKRKEFTFDAKQIATDICRGINDNGPGEGSFFGVFVCAGQEPSADELENAQRRLRSYFMQMISGADAEWSNNPRHDLISGIAKRAARYLKIDPDSHPWLTNFNPTAECPVCGERIKPGVALCRSCGAILDEEKAAQFGIVTEKPVPPMKRGIPKKEQPIV